MTDLQAASMTAVYIAIGAHTDKKIGIPGEDSRGRHLRRGDARADIGDDDHARLHRQERRGHRRRQRGHGRAPAAPSAWGRRRSSCVYRRRQADMTALAEEVEGAVAEGAELLTLQAPVRIEADENGNAVALWVQPQMIGVIDAAGRPRPSSCRACRRSASPLISSSSPSARASRPTALSTPASPSTGASSTP